MTLEDARNSLIEYEAKHEIDPDTFEISIKTKKPLNTQEEKDKFLVAVNTIIDEMNKNNDE